jgi:hypothetical protein
VAMMAVIVNAANLLPFHPLDGGRIVHALVTAGRPRLDLAFKSIATLVFIVGGLAAKDLVLGSIAVVGVLGWPSTLRLARLEERIRRTPGFDPRLPASERRGYVFRTLAGEPSGQGRQWAATVTALDMPLGYPRSPAWRAVAVALGLVALVAGGLWAGKRAMSSLGPKRCPSSEGAVRLACAASPDFAEVVWKRGRASVPPPSTDDPDVRRRFPLNSFVWCRADEDPDGHIATLAHELREATAAGYLCTALPWEELPPEPATSAGARAKARATFAGLRHTRYLHGPKGLEIFDEDAQEMGTAADPEVVQLLREMVASPRDAPSAREARNKLADRLGRSATESCTRIGIANVARGGASEAAADGGEPPSSGGAREGSWVRFSVGVATPTDFAPLAAYLCNAGCRIEVLPVDPDDRGLAFCF